MVNFPKGDVDVSFTEFMPDLFPIARAQKQCFSDIHHHIVGIPGAGGHQLAQLLGNEDGYFGAVRTVTLGLMGDEMPD